MNSFKENGYIYKKNKISQDVCKIVTNYALFDEIQNYSKEYNLYGESSRVPNAHSKYADPLMESILIYLKNIIEEEIEISLYPTYSYYRVYRNNDDLSFHKDRESCEISCSVCFGYSYEQHLSWPLIVNNKEFKMSPGDILIYKGIELEHGRKPLISEKNVWHVQGFFHYVDKNGPYSNMKYDKREKVGINPMNNNVNKKYLQFLEKNENR